MKINTVSLIVILIVVSFLSYYFLIYKQGDKMFTEEDAKKAILKVKEKFGLSMAQLVEKMMRLETAHFTSRQYVKTGSAGMEEGQWKNLPYPMDSIPMDDTLKPGLERFIVWRGVDDFAIYLANYINRYDGNYARWNSKDPIAQAEYRNRVNSIRSKFV